MKKLTLFLFLNFALASVRGDDLRFLGESSNSDLVYLRARYYDTETGSFIAKDPLGVSAGFNQYQYVAANPVNKIDPTGLVLETVWDVANVGLGGYSLGTNLRDGNYGWAAVDTAGLAYDLTATAIPFLPAGASAALSASRFTPETIYSTSKIIEYTDNALSGAIKLGDNVTFSPQILGNRIHNQISDMVDKNYFLGGFENSFAKGHSGADLVSSNGSYFLDVTTSGSWTSHLRQYGDTSTSGIGVLYDRGSGLLSTRVDYGMATSVGSRLYSGAGASLFAAQGMFSLGGVLIDKAATLIGQNLSDIKGASFDPVSKQIVFLGSNNASAVKDINMDYFYTAVQAVYGSAVPPFVTLDPPASAITQWTDWTDGDGIFEPGETGGFVLRYNPIWVAEDSTVDVRVRASWSGTQYDFNLRFQAVERTNVTAGGRHLMDLDYVSATGLPAGVSLRTAPFVNNIPPNLSLSANSQDSYWAQREMISRSPQDESVRSADKGRKGRKEEVKELLS